MHATLGLRSCAEKRFLPFTANIEAHRSKKDHIDLSVGTGLTMPADSMGATGDSRLQKNYSLVFASGIAFSTAKQLANAKLVLPFIYLALGAPVIFAGLLLPLMRAAQLIAELLIAPFLQDVARAKRSVFLPTLISAISLSVVAVTAEYMPRTAVIGLFLITAIVLGLCKGVLHVGYGQLFGIVVPSDRRIWITFSVALVAGVLAIVVALITKDLLASDHPLQRHIIVLWIGIAAMVAAAVFVAGVRLVEGFEGQPKTGAVLPLLSVWGQHRARILQEFTRHSFIRQELWRGVRTGMQYPWYRRFSLSSMLSLSVLLAMPFYTIHAASYHKGAPQGLAILVIAASAGIAAGAPFWRRTSIRSNKRVIILGTFVAAVSAVLALLLDFTNLATNIWLYAIVIFLLGFGANGVGNGMGLYFIEMTTAVDRPCLMALNDMAVGIVAIGVSAALGTVAHWSNPTIPIMVLLALNVVAGLYAFALFEPAAAAQPRPTEFGTDLITAPLAGQQAAT